MNGWTVEQQKALALDHNLSVTAGAGSGKTKILVDRFLKIAFAHPEKVRRILAITFTKKAAAEMLERIIRVINQQLATADQGVEREKLLDIRDQISSAAVSTIHGFCARVLREFPFEAGLPPDFSEADEMQSIVLRRQAIDQTLEWLDEAGEKLAFYLPLFNLLQLRTVQELLNRALEMPYEMARVAQLFEHTEEDQFLDDLERNWLAMVKPILPVSAVRIIRESCQTILRADRVDEKNKKGMEVRELLQKMSDLPADSLETVSSYSLAIALIDRMTTGNQTAYKNLANIGTNNGWSSEAHEELKLLSQHCAHYAGPLQEAQPGPAPGENDRLWFRLLGILLDLLEKCRANYENLKNEAGLLDFEDLQLRTLDLLENNPDVREKLSRRYDFIMVDEFQDTNSLQWEIISRLAQNGSGLMPDKLFVVGDPKQSIYGFRQADVRVFLRVKKVFADLALADSVDDYPGNIVFKESFRFLPGLNEFINLLFSQILQRSEENPYSVGYDALKAARRVEASGAVEVAFLPDDVEEPLYMAYAVQKLINEKRPCFVFEDGEERERPIRHGDIAILLRSRTNLLDIEQTFREQDIPFKTVAGTGFWQRQEIYDFYHLLRFLDNPYDDLALVAVLRSPILLLSDEDLYLLSLRPQRHWLDKLTETPEKDELNPQRMRRVKFVGETLLRWLEWRAGMTLEELLYAIIEDTNLWLVLSGKLNGEQLTANLVKLIDHIRRFESSGIGGLGAYIENLEYLIQEEMKEGEAPMELEDTETVKIMTIHASKGLQFPVVFLPFLNADNRGKPKSVWLDPEVGVASRLNDPVNGEHQMLHRLKIRQKLKDEAERRRLFYVGATRASNYLFLSGTIKKEINERNTPLGWLADVLSRAEIDIEREGPVDSAPFNLQILRSMPKETEQTTTRKDRVALLQDLIRQIPASDTPAAGRPLFAAVRDAAGAQTFSATRLMTYLRDPQEYYRRYHLGFFENDYEVFAADIQAEDLTMLKGKMVHRFFELLPGAESVDRLIDQVLFEYEIFDPELRVSLTEEVIGYHARARQSPVAQKMLQASAFRNEVTVTAALGENYLTGTLDRLFQNENRQWEVLDYKTNRIEKDQVAATGQRYLMQIKAYVLLLSRLYPDQTEYAVSLYFLQPDCIDRHLYTSEEVQKISVEFADLMRRIVEEFAPINSW